MTEFTLYSRSYCHLCEDMLVALQALGKEYTFTIQVVDVDADPGLVEQYDELVPVLIGRQGNNNMYRLCHYFLDEARVKAFLQGNFSDLTLV